MEVHPCDGLREGQTPMLIYDASTEKKPDGLVSNMYRPENWAINNQVAAQLAGLSAASKVLEATKGYPTSNLVLPYTFGVMATLEVGVDIIQFWDGKTLAFNDLRPEVKSARADMLEDMEDYWWNLEDHELELYQICSLCDPRLKQLAFPLVEDEWKAKAKAAFIAQYEMNWAPSVESNDDNDSELNEPEAAAEPAKPPPSMGSFTDFMATVSHLTKQPATPSTPRAQAPAQPQLSEVEMYLREPAVDMSEDIFVWWGLNEDRLPNLARMAAQYLGIPASSAAAERVFSISGRIYGDLSQNMTSKTLEERMFAKVNTGRRKV